MNRQYKRLMKKEQQRKASAPRQMMPKPAGPPMKRERTPPRQFIKEVIAELRKVSWPNREEVVGYSTVVLIGVVIITAVIFGMDYVFSRIVLALFGIDV